MTDPSETLPETPPFLTMDDRLGIGKLTKAIVTMQGRVLYAFNEDENRMFVSVLSDQDVILIDGKRYTAAQVREALAAYQLLGGTGIQT